MKKQPPAPIEQFRLDNLVRASAISQQIFGEASLFAIGEIADYLEDADEDAEEEFHADMQRAEMYAKTLFELKDDESPTPEQVFFCLERVILTEAEPDEAEPDEE
jgi:hypothetical protein